MSEIKEGFVIFTDDAEKEINKYALIKKGKEQANQVIGLAQWISKYGSVVLTEIRTNKEKYSGSTIYDIVIAFAGVLDVDALITMFMIITGCAKKEAETYFDIALLIDAAIETYNEQPSFKKVVNRFFSEQE